MAPIPENETNGNIKRGPLADFYPAPGIKTAVVFDQKSDKAAIDKIVQTLKSAGEEPASLDVTGKNIPRFLKTVDRQSLPLAVVKGDIVDLDQLTALSSNGALKEWLQPHDYDLVVIGGGSGGLAAAKEAAQLGAKVACLDFVKPTPIGTTWGLGGTCVNVGCIPKKLMHQAAILGHSIDDAARYGWNVPGSVHSTDDEHNAAQPSKITHDWEKMRQAVQDYIGSLNWSYRVQLRENTVTYINSYGRFTGPHTIVATNKKGKEQKITADRFLIAAGLRPKYADVEGDRELCITSDDLFSLSKSPGKTLCVGASYIALECAGFINGLGCDTTVMVRSILLRGFDQDMAERIGAHMAEQGVKFQRPCVPTKFERAPSGRILVHGRMQNGEQTQEEYDTVVLAIGREARTDDLALNQAHVEASSKSKKIIARRNEQSVSAPWVYAIGDVIEGGLELTPVAIQAGRFLMQRLYEHKFKMVDYRNVPTTVFSPLEYGACGMSEEDAIKIYGDENIDVYHNVFNPLEHTVAARKDAKHCYAKMIVIRQGASKGKVLGLHYLGPNAGEVMQGFGLAFQFDCTKDHIDQLVGIHPTTAEWFTTMTTTKREKAVMEASGC